MTALLDPCAGLPLRAAPIGLRNCWRIVEVGADLRDAETMARAAYVRGVDVDDAAENAAGIRAVWLISPEGDPWGRKDDRGPWMPVSGMVRA